jgi:peptidoglycan/LPS O-acetylase OafA/YrhL
MLPIGPKWMQLNSTAGPMGMSIFFTLSGFLITSALLRRADALSFFVKRLFRIVPLAFLGSTLILFLQQAPFHAYVPMWLFYYNYTPGVEGIKHVSHFWSLCVEVHFYILIGLVVAMAGRSGLCLLPFAGLLVTYLRIREGVYLNNNHLRMDEILAGASLALIAEGELGRNLSRMKGWIRNVPLSLALLVFAASCHPQSGWAQYFRPYAGAIAVGMTLSSTGRTQLLLKSWPLRYIAEISYALYIIHPASMMGWLGSGETLERYMKRPLSFGITFCLAHMSTYYFERPCTGFGRLLVERWTEVAKRHRR